MSRVKLPERCLSVRQPYAQLLVSERLIGGAGTGLPYKWCENRDWIHPPKRRGRIGIHASQAKPSRALVMQESDDLEFTPSDFPLGAIIGTVEIFAVVSAGFRTDNQIDREVRSKLEAAGFDPSCGAIRSGWKHISYAEQMILVRNPIRFEEPIPHKGALNFWRPKRDSAVASGTHEQP